MTCRSRYDELIAAERLSELKHYMDTTASNQPNNEDGRDLSGTEIVVFSKSIDDLRRFVRDSKNPTFGRVKTLTLVFNAEVWNDGQDDLISTALYDLQDQLPPHRPHSLETVKIVVEGNFVFTRCDYILCSTAGSEDTTKQLKEFAIDRVSFADIAAKQLRNPTQRPYKILSFEKQVIKTLLRIRGVKDVQISGPMEQVLTIDLMTAMKSPAGTPFVKPCEERRRYLEPTNLEKATRLSDESESGVSDFQFASMMRNSAREPDDHEPKKNSSDDESESASDDDSGYAPSHNARIPEHKSSDLTKRILPTNKYMRFVLGWEAPRGMRRARLAKASPPVKRTPYEAPARRRPNRKSVEYDSDVDMDVED